MYCKKCGKELRAQDNFCTGCGTAIVRKKIETRIDKQDPKPNDTMIRLKKYSGLILNAIAVLISLYYIRFGTLKYGVEDSRLFDDLEAIDRIYKHGNISLINGITVIAVIFEFVVSLLAIGHMIRSLVLIKKNYEKSIYSSSTVLKHIGKIGIVSVMLPIIINCIYYSAMKSAVLRTYSPTSAYGVNESMSDEEKEQLKDQKEDAIDELKDYYDDEKLNIPFSAVLMIIIGFGGAYAVDRLTYEFTKEYNRQKEKTTISRISGYVFGSKTASSTAPDSWKCDYCGAINKPTSISCSNCYHKRYE